ncbi:hypothetical protein [Halorientalis pallida]|uniref:Uncharacterized protein n=1 Tax=Halorientalis pallida TaxID=2479928 RepID=A0A498KWZ1_9EURY|nr:hypothetical protein [Halorientalis pallida]RXK46252.1 hypothetical protein EAF64_20255 [Halorientalis pallida]
MVVVALVVLYSLLVVQRPLLGALVASWVLGLYVAWRFVSWFVAAYHRRTVAMESMADSLEPLAEQEGASPTFDGGDETR